MAKRTYRRIKAAPKRHRRRTVSVRAYCRRRARSAFQRAEEMRRSMPF